MARLDNLANLRPDQGTVILVLGHSYVKRYERDMKKEARFNDSSLKSAAGFTENDMITPWFCGEPGGKVSELLIDHESSIIRYHPHIVIIDMGINDVSNHLIFPEYVAENLVKHAETILENFTEIEIIVLCYVLRRDRMSRSIKPVDAYNLDVDTFNHEILRQTRKNIKILRWKHVGLKTLTTEVSSDGVHPDTFIGKLRYKKSIYAACKMARNEMLRRRTLSKTQIRKMQKLRRTEKKKKGIEKLKAKYPCARGKEDDVRKVEFKTVDNGEQSGN